MKSEGLPRSGSVIHNFHFQDEITKKRKLKRWQKLNKYLVVPLYRSGILPLLGFGRIILLLTTIELRTGKKRRTPLEYRIIDGCMTIFSAMGEKSAWVKNLHANPKKVSVKRGFHQCEPIVEFINEPIQERSIMKTYVIKFGKSAKMLFGWNPKKDDPDSTDFSKLIDCISIIKLHNRREHFPSD